MTARKLDGKALAATMRSEVAARIAERALAGNRPPGRLDAGVVTRRATSWLLRH